MANRVCIIPARAGSKGLPNKNILPFRGLPLLAHSVKQALGSGLFSEVAVSSDSDEYLEIARAAGATFYIKRPDELASDQAGTIDVLLHGVLACEKARNQGFDSVTLLQATSPLRQSQHIREAVAKLEDGQFDSVVSVTAAKNSPYFNLLEYDADHRTYGLSKKLGMAVTRRQDAPAVYQLNGSIYVWSRAALFTQKASLCKKTEIYLMSNLHSVDIDTSDDWAFAELAAELIAKNSAAAGLAGQGT
jgi:CMP-N,N'-diacetyllegionaminic acid synthase